MNHTGNHMIFHHYFSTNKCTTNSMREAFLQLITIIATTFQ